MSDTMTWRRFLDGTCPSCGSRSPYLRGHRHPGLRITHCHAVMGNHQGVTPCDDSWHGEPREAVEATS